LLELLDLLVRFSHETFGSFNQRVVPMGVFVMTSYVIMDGEFLRILSEKRNFFWIIATRILAMDEMR
jgi:hypothetical protein